MATMDMKNGLAVAFLTIAFFITLYTWAFLEQVSWLPHPRGGGMGSGLAIVSSLAVLRWLSLGIAFLFLALSGKLNTWASSTIVQLLMAFAGITLMEIFMLPVQLRSVANDVPPSYQAAYRVAVILLPLLIMASGHLGSRLLFGFTIAAMLLGAAWKVPEYREPPLNPNALNYILLNVAPGDPPEAILQRLDENPGWVKKLSGEIGGPHTLNAAFLLSLRPPTLREDAQEHCWKAAIREAAMVKPIRDNGENWMPSDVRTIARIINMLAGIPGPVRDRHRAEFVMIRDLVDFYRNQNPEQRHPELPDLVQADWVPGGQ